MEKVLVTGGAGFIGSHTVDNLVERGYKIRILDNLEPEVHKEFPKYLNKEADFIRGDVTSPEDWQKALKDVDAIIHLAGLTGLGQSMFQPARYMNVNVLGTSLMYQAIMNMDKKPERIVVAGSRASYGEGAYFCESHGEIHPDLRNMEQLKKKDWEHHCPVCGEYIKPIAVKESKLQQNPNIYALTKYNQEKMALRYGNVLNIPTVVLRYFNVYGPRQSLHNSYTGVAAIFSSRIKNKNPPVLYEDGKQIRDFMFVEDIAEANVLALERGEGIYNASSGEPITMLEVANLLIKLYSSDVQPEVTQQYRKGDTRSDFADISLIKKEIGWKPKTSINTGFKKLVEWGFGEEAQDNFDAVTAELKKYKLLE